jgi:hypothetical protein
VDKKPNRHSVTFELIRAAFWRLAFHGRRGGIVIIGHKNKLRNLQGKILRKDFDVQGDKSSG